MFEYKQADSKLLILVGIFTALYTLSNIIAIKQVDLGPFIIPLGVLAIPITFLVTDVINEVYGSDVAKSTVKVGFIAMAFVLVITQIAIRLSPSVIFGGQESYVAIFGAVPRVTLASVCAYIVSQYHDVWAFHFWRKKTDGKYLWIRNNASTVVSQLLDTIIFIVIAFAGVIPFDALKFMILGQLLIKWILALLDTPFCYWLVLWAKKG
ncbi:MAG: queuosine precursor transporter [Sphaerochaetaceae bacterium]